MILNHIRHKRRGWNRVEELENFVKKVQREIKAGGVHERVVDGKCLLALVGSWEIFWYFFFGKKSTRDEIKKLVMHCI